MSTICQYCILDAEADPELAEEVAALRSSDEDEDESNYGGDDCDICGG